MAAAKRHRLLRVIGIIVLAIPLLVVLLLAFITIPPGEELVRSILASQLSSRLHQPVSIGRFETNLFSRVRLDAITVTSAQGEDEPPVLALKSVEVHYDLSGLLHHEARVTAFVVDTTRINVVRDSIHGSNLVLLDSLGKAPEDTAKPAPSEWKFLLDRAMLSSLSVRYLDRQSGMRAHLQDLYAMVERSGNDVTTFDVRTGEGSATVQKMTIDPISMRAHGRMTSHAIGIDNFRFAVAEFLAEGNGTLPMDSTGSMALDARISGELQKMYNLASGIKKLPDIRFTGPLEGTIQARGKRTHPAVAVNLVLPAINVSHADMGRGRLVASYQGDVATLDSFWIPVFNGEISMQGKAYLKPELTADGTVNLRQMNLPALLSALQNRVSPFSGEVNGGLGLKIRGTDPRGWLVDAGFDITKFMYEAVTMADLKLRAHMENGTFTANVDNADSHVESRVAVGSDSTLSGTAAIRIPTLAPYAAMIRGSHLEGKLDADATVSGTLRHPLIAAKLAGDEIKYRDFPLDSLRAFVLSDGKSVKIQDAHLAGAWENKPGEKGPLGMDSLSGAVRYQAQVSGKPSDLQGRMDILASSIVYGRYHVDSLRLAASIDSSIVRLEDVSLANDTMALRLNGTYDLAAKEGALEGRLQPAAPLQAGAVSTVQGGLIAAHASLAGKAMQGHFEASDVDLGSLLRLIQDSVRVTGRATITADFKGTPKDPDASITMTLRQPSFHGIALDSVLFNGGVQGQVASLRSLDVYGHDQRLHGTATIGLVRDSAGGLTVTEKSKTSGSVETRQFNLRAAQAVLPDTMELAGVASVLLRWTGTVGSPALDGTVALDSFHMVPNKRVGPIAFMMHGSIHGRRFQIDSSKGTILNRPFAVAGTLTAEQLSRFNADMSIRVGDSSMVIGKGTVSSERLDFQTTIKQFDIGIAQPFVASLNRLEGVADGKVTLSGSMKAPQAQGELAVTRIALQPAALDSPMTDGVVKARFQGNDVHVDSVFIRSGGGFLLTSGDLTIANGGLGTVALNTIIRNFAASSEDMFTAKIDSATIGIRNDNQVMTVDGDIKLGETRLTKNVDPDLIFSSGGGRKVEVAPALGQARETESTRLNLRVHQSDSVWIDNNIAKMRLDAEVGIRGTPSHPLLSGKVSVKEGKIMYLDRDFDVKQGDIYFTDPNKINPEVQFTAESEVTSYSGLNSSVYVITLSLQGLVSELVVNLTSDPPLDQPDIVSLLTLGATRQQMAGGGGTQGGASSVIANRAKTLAGEKAASYLGEKAGKLLGLDQVTVTGDLFSSNEQTGPQLLVSKRISKKAKVSYSTQVGHMNDQSIRLDYDLTSHISLSGETDQGGNSALSIRYRIQFP